MLIQYYSSLVKMLMLSLLPLCIRHDREVEELANVSTVDKVGAPIGSECASMRHEPKDFTACTVETYVIHGQ